MANFLTSDVNDPGGVGEQTVYFHTLQFPHGIATKINYTSRTGVDGYSVWRTGVRGEQFSVLTTADFQSFALAYDEFHTKYMAMRGQRRALVYEDQDVLEYYDVVVVDCQPAGSGRRRGAYKTLRHIGGLSGDATDGGVVRARWTFLGIAKYTLPP